MSIERNKILKNDWYKTASSLEMELALAKVELEALQELRRGLDDSKAVDKPTVTY